MRQRTREKRESERAREERKRGEGRGERLTTVKRSLSGQVGELS